MKKIIDAIKKMKKPSIKSFKKLSKANDQFVDYEKAFFCSDGAVYYSLAQLSEGLAHMPSHVFESHVNEDKHDFHNWIKNVFDAQDLANLSANIKDQKNLKNHIDLFLR